MSRVAIVALVCVCACATTIPAPQVWIPDTLAEPRLRPDLGVEVPSEMVDDAMAKRAKVPTLQVEVSR